MKTKVMLLSSIFLAMHFFAMPPSVDAQFSVDVESGAVFSGYNDVRIPGDVGTDISFTDDLESGSTGFFRIRLAYSLNEKSSFTVLIAPLRVDADGEVDKPVAFNGVTFPAYTPLQAKYRFDSYRLSYRYDFHRTNTLQAGIGLTAKIRDAAISLTGNRQTSEKKNTGFVPLINFRLHWRFADHMGFVVDGDALAAPQGRAEDVLLAVHYEASKRVALKAGYRLLEGGADNDEVYTFTLFHYIVLGAHVTF